MKTRPCMPAAAALSAVLVGVAACSDGHDDETAAMIPVVDQAELTALDEGVSMTKGAAGKVDALSAVLGATEIPYPVYPNGSKYRVGGENGLKIVVFQTEDDFDAVDAYFRDATAEADMPRLVAMNDYVRYSKSSTDEDPWATYRPGIVIHEFGDEGERRAVGARQSARTNIIMSF